MIDDRTLEFLDADTTIALDTLVAASGLSRETVIGLVEWGVFPPAGEPWTFASRTVVVAHRAATSTSTSRRAARAIAEAADAQRLAAARTAPGS